MFIFFTDNDIILRSKATIMVNTDNKLLGTRFKVLVKKVTSKKVVFMLRIA